MIRDTFKQCYFTEATETAPAARSGFATVLFENFKYCLVLADHILASAAIEDDFEGTILLRDLRFRRKPFRMQTS